MGKIFEAWKKLGYKLTGKKIKDSENLSTIINDIADKYEGGGGGGTTVVANPTLAGTEADLTGLQVGDTKYKVPSGGGADLGAQYQNCNKVYDLFNAACPYDETLGAYKQTKLDTAKLKALLLAANLDLTKLISESDSGNSLCICVPPIAGYGTEGTAEFSGGNGVFVVYNINITVNSDTGAPTAIEVASDANIYIDSIEVDSSDEPHIAALTSSSTFADLLDAMIADNVNLNFTAVNSDYSTPIPFEHLGYIGFGNEIKNAPVFTTIIGFISSNGTGKDIISNNIYFDDFIECLYVVEE